MRDFFQATGDKSPKISK